MDCLTWPAPDSFLTFMNVLLKRPKDIVESSVHRDRCDADMGQVQRWFVDSVCRSHIIWFKVHSRHTQHRLYRYTTGENTRRISTLNCIWANWDQWGCLADQHAVWCALIRWYWQSRSQNGQYFTKGWVLLCKSNPTKHLLRWQLGYGSGRNYDWPKMTTINISIHTIMV